MQEVLLGFQSDYNPVDTLNPDFWPQNLGEGGDSLQRFTVPSLLDPALSVFRSRRAETRKLCHALDHSEVCDRKTQRGKHSGGLSELRERHWLPMTASMNGGSFAQAEGAQKTLVKVRHHGKMELIDSF